LVNGLIGWDTVRDSVYFLISPIILGNGHRENLVVKVCSLIQMGRLSKEPGWTTKWADKVPASNLTEPATRESGKTTNSMAMALKNGQMDLSIKASIRKAWKRDKEFSKLLTGACTKVRSLKTR
jgi:hypothetical protein